MDDKKYWDRALETIHDADRKALELDALKRELAYVSQKSPFYKEKFESFGVRPDSLKSLKDLRRFPYTTKDELRETQEKYGGLGGHQCAAIQDIIRIQGTSGTTGRPLFIGLTRKDVHTWNELFARHAWTGGLRPEDVMINPANFTLFVGGLSECSGAEHMGVTVIPAPFVSTGTEKFMMLIQTILQVDPSELGFKKGFLAGEALSEDERTRIENTWHITARNFYGLADVAADIAAECGQSTGLHFCAQGALIPELIDPETLEPIAMEDGAEGEIVFTTINREATPVIRYRVRDMARVFTSPCQCGRTGFRFQVIGRTDDMIKVKGVNVFPSAVKGVIQSFSPETTGEFRIVLPHPGPSFGENLTIKVEYGENIKKEDLEQLGVKLRTAIREKLVFSPVLEWLSPGALQRSQYKVAYFERSYEKE
jgi:phenylacetate-CoA ligase